MTDRGRFTDDGIQFDRTLPATPEVVWRAITDPAEIGAWMDRTDIDGRVGGALTVHFEGSPVTGTILVWEPPEALEYTWIIDGEIKSVVRFELEPLADGTRLRLWHRALPADQELGYAPGWHAYLDRLLARLSAEPMPDWTERFSALRAEYRDLREAR